MRIFQLETEKKKMYYVMVEISVLISLSNMIIVL